MKYAGVVVLYQPEEKVIDNIKSYSNFLDKVYVIDNSDSLNSNFERILLQEIHNAVFIYNHGNKGIAFALNVGAKRAVTEKYDWLLTMDQDSIASQDMLPNLQQYIEKNDMKTVGIISAFQKLQIDNYNYHMKDIEQKLVVATSGNFLNLKAYKETGKFKEKLFIDMVDYDYSLRLNQKKYQVIVYNKAILIHSNGNATYVDKAILYNHSHERIYYFVRNWLYIQAKYKIRFPLFFEEKGKEIKLECLKYILYKEKKVKTLVYMLRGYMDYKRNKFGRIGERIEKSHKNN